MIKFSDYYWTRETGFLVWHPTKWKKFKNLFCNLYYNAKKKRRVIQWLKQQKGKIEKK